MAVKHTPIGQLGEFGLIEKLKKSIVIKQSSTVAGIGDDAAVVSNTEEVTLVSTDMLLEGIHFDLGYHPLKHLGYKAVVVNLSDIYAMNANPTHITVSIGLSNRFSVEAVEELYSGIRMACDLYEVDLVGGDTTSSGSGLILSITAIGQQTKDRVVYRNTAQKGDIICVTGDLGAAYLGLQLLEREKQIFIENPEMQPDLENQEYLIQRQLRPEARKDMWDLFQKANLVPTSMIDVSDGLASELLHICTSSGVGAFIEEDSIPILNDAKLKAIDFGLDPVNCALSGGEDYELLFTVSPKDLEKVRVLPDLHLLGEIVDKEDGVKLHSRGGEIHDITAQGWNHF